MHLPDEAISYAKATNADMLSAELTANETGSAC